MNLVNSLTTAAFCFVASFAQAQTVAYAPNGGNSTSLDVYSFDGANNAPVMVYIHGGAWVTGDKSRVHQKDNFFLSRGYVFISVNYTLVPHTTVEGQLEDIDAALGYILANVARVGGNPNNISLMGHSAGAHLVTMTALRPLRNAQALLASNGLKAVISNDTRAYNLPRMAAESGGSLSETFSRPFGQNPARWAALSPISYVATAPNLPRFLLTHSAQGDAIARAGAVHGFANALRREGAVVQVFDGAGYNHMQISRAVGVEADINAAILAVLNSQ